MANPVVGGPSQPVHITGSDVNTGGGSGDASAANQAALNTLTGAVTETAPASDTASSGLNGRLQRIAQRITSLIALIPAALTGSGNFKVAVQEALPAGVVLAVGGSTVTIPVTTAITRPSNTTAYASGDAVTDSISAPTVMTFANCVRANGGSGRITGGFLVDSAAQTTKGAFELWLFSAAPTPDNDNAVFTPTDGEMATVVAVLTFSAAYVGDATSGAGGNVLFIADPIAQDFVCGGSTRDLKGLMVVRNGYAPVSGEIFTPSILITQD